jgi:hypothetical protein
MQDAKELLGRTLEEEKETDEKLTQIAGQINVSAEEGDTAADEDEDGDEEDGEATPVVSAARSVGGTRSKRK